MSWTVDERYAPIVLLRMTGMASDQELDAYVAQLGDLMTRLMKKGQSWPAIVVTKVEHTDAKERARIGKAHDRLSAEQTKMLVSYMVIDNAMFRGMLTAMSWLMPGKLGKVMAVKSFELALDGALEALEQRGLPEPANLAELRHELVSLADAS